MGNVIENNLAVASRCMANDSDEELLLYMAEQKTNPEDARLAWEEFYRRHIKYIWNICRKVLENSSLDKDTINDIVIDTFSKVYISAHTYQLGNEESSDKIRRRVRAWLGTVAKNATIDFLSEHKSKKAIQLEPDEWNQIDNGQESFISMDTKNVRALMDKVLDERERAVLIATYLHYKPDKNNQRLPNNVVADLCDYFATTPANLRRIRKTATEKIKKALVNFGYKNKN